MPEETRIYAPDTRKVREQLASDPFLSGHLFQIGEGVLQARSPSFLAIRAEDDSIGTICSEQARRTWPAQPTSIAATGLGHIYRQFSWFQHAHPCFELLALLNDMAYRYRTAIVCYHWMERGDELYYEFFWGFDYRNSANVAVDVTGRYDLYGESLYIAQTHLMTQRRQIIRGHAPMRMEPLETDAYDHVPRYLNITPFHPFFQPDVYYQFGWERHRVIGLP